MLIWYCNDIITILQQSLKGPVEIELDNPKMLFQSDRNSWCVSRREFFSGRNRTECFRLHKSTDSLCLLMPRLSCTPYKSAVRRSCFDVLSANLFNADAKNEASRPSNRRLASCAVKPSACQLAVLSISACERAKIKQRGRKLPQLSRFAVARDVRIPDIGSKKEI